MNAQTLPQSREQPPQSREQPPQIHQGTRYAVETAIQLSKGNKSKKWGSLSSQRISQWPFEEEDRKEE